MNGKNALAELAKYVRGQIEYLYRDGYYGKGMTALNKAQRIVAELAKVSEGAWVEDSGGKFYLCRLEDRVVETAVGRCRAIAEEGLK